jgi:hypothetical protein
MVLVKVQAVDTEWISRKKEFSQKTNSVLTLCFSVCVPFYFNPAPPLPSFYNNTHPPTHPSTPQKKRYSCGNRLYREKNLKPQG